MESETPLKEQLDELCRRAEARVERGRLESERWRESHQRIERNLAEMRLIAQRWGEEADRRRRCWI